MIWIIKKIANFRTPAPSVEVLRKIQNASPDCGICLEKIKKKSECLFCKTCEKILHYKCNTITITKEFECIQCIENKNPFYNIDNIELLNLSYNSIINCCVHTFVNNFRSTNITKLCIAELNPDKSEPYYSEIDVHTDLDLNFDYFDLHEFHKMSSKIDHSFEFQYPPLHVMVKY